MSSISSFLEDGTGLWSQCLVAPRDRERPCIFLDRDGVLVDEVHFLRRRRDVRLSPGIAEQIGKANGAGLAVVVVTNQSGIARGHLGWEEFSAVQAEIVEQLQAAGAVLDGVFACGYHRDGEPPYDIANHEWRKPRPGMLVHAARRLALDLAGSVIVGDRMSDLEAGRNAGLTGGTLVMTGYGRGHAQGLAAARGDPDWNGFGLHEAQTPARAVGEALAALAA